MTLPSFTAYFVELLFAVFLIVTVRTVAGRWLGPGVRRLLWGLLILKALVPLTVATPYHPLMAMAKLDVWMTPPATPMDKPTAAEAGASRDAGVSPARPADVPSAAVGVEDDSSYSQGLLYGAHGEGETPSRHAGGTPASHEAPLTAQPTAERSAVAGVWAAAVAALPAVWLLGAVALFGVAVWQNRTVIRATTQDPVAVPDWVRTIFLDCRQRLGLRTMPGLVVSPYIPSPCLVGALRPRVLIPELLVEQRSPESETRIRHLLLHELTHLKQGDVWLAWLWTLALAVQWFNPLFWLLGRWFRFDCESACDDRVLTLLNEHERPNYGISLLHMLIDTTPSHDVPHRATPRFAPGFLGLAEPRSNLERRLTMMKSHRMPSWTRRLSAVVVLLLIGALCLTSYAQTKQPIPADKAKWIGYIETWFIDNNSKDFIARKPLAWGDPTTDDKGNVTITYKYDVTLLNNDHRVIEDRFTFDKNGQFVEVKNLSKEYPVNGVTKEVLKAAGGWIDTYFRENEPKFVNRKASRTTVIANDDGTYSVEYLYIAPIGHTPGIGDMNLLATKRFTFDKSGKYVSHADVMGTMVFADGDPKADAETTTATQPASQSGDVPPAFAATRQLLQRPIVSVDFNEQPLESVLQWLRDVMGAKIVVDWKALEAAGVKDPIVTVQLRDTTFEAVLTSVLKSASGPRTLAYGIDKDGVIHILPLTQADADAPDDKLALSVIKLTHARANDTMPLLRQHIKQGGLQVDVRTNSILLTADAADTERVKAIIAKLDVPVDEKPAAKVTPLPTAGKFQAATQAELELARAESDAKIKIAEATLKQKTIMFERLKVTYEASGHGATGTELKLTEQEVIIAEQQLELEKIARKRIEAAAPTSQPANGAK